MATGLEVDVDGVERLSRKMRGVQGALRNLKPAFRVIGRTMRKRTAEQFQTRGRAHGTRWKPLAPGTIKAKMRGWGYYGGGGGVSGKMLASRGGLRRSFTSKAHQDHVETIRRQSMEWGSSHNLAHLHAQGPQSRGPAGPLPQREIIAFQSEREKSDVMREPVREHVLDEFE